MVWGSETKKKIVLVYPQLGAPWRAGSAPIRFGLAAQQAVSSWKALGLPLHGLAEDFIEGTVSRT
jgi:hypothetical protein